MARYAYDVNRTQRLIDVHKQFSGGLKTVDTDDALGAVFLRDAENVSLSEFGFLEKRYGTYKNFAIQNGVTANSKLQGFWEFYPEETLYQIMAIDGDFYVNGTKVTTYYTEEDLRYPDFATKFTWTKDALTWTDVSFQSTKEISGVIKNDLIYFFTGTYPVYAAEFTENDVTELRFYLLPVDIPTYDEIVVVGHNLLENDYEDVYFKNAADIQYTNPGASTTAYATLAQDLEKPPFFFVQKDENDIEVKDYAPMFPYQDGGELDLNFKYVFKPTYLQEYNVNPPISYLYQPRVFLLDIDSVGYRASGAGAGASDYLFADLDSIDYKRLHNYTGTENLSFSVDEPLIEREEINYQSHFGVSGSGGYKDASTDLGIMYHNNIISTTGEAGDVGEVEFDLNTEKSGVDFISKTKFLPGDVFEFQLREQTTSSSDPTPPIFIPENVVDFFNLYTNQTFTDTPLGSNVTNFKAPKIRIVPVDINNNEFTDDKIVISGTDLEKTSTGYKFTVPANLANTATITGYNISLRAELFFNHIQSGLTQSDMNFPTLVTKELVKLEDLKAGSEYVLSNSQNLGIKIKNLLSGTYDFRIRYKLTKYTKNNIGYLEFEDVDDGVEYADVNFYNISITSEKIQDYSGSEGVPTKLEALWECNKVIEHFGKLMVWGSKQMPNSVFYSFPDRPSFFPSKFYLDFGSESYDPVMAVTPFMNILVVQTINQTWGVRGNSGYLDSPAPYTPFTINTTVGTIAPKSVRPVRNHLFFLSNQGIIALKSLYAADEQYNIDFVDRNIRNIVPQDAEAVGIQYDNQYWLNFPEKRITLRWYIDKKSWVLDRYNAWNQFNGVFKYQVVNGQLEFITKPSLFEEDGNLEVYKIGVDYSLAADLGGTIVSKFETSFLNQNYPFHLKNYKEFKYDFTMQNEYNFSRDPIYDKTFAITDSVTVIGLQGADLTQPLLKNHTYMLSFSDVVEVDTLEVNGVVIDNLVKYDGSYYLDGNTDYFFTLPNYIEGKLDIDIQLTEAIQGLDERVSLRDTTYDETMVFLSKVITEERNVINQQLPIGYQEQQESIEVNLADFQDFSLGTTFFGDRVTFVKTIKLSGKGYNAKAYFEDSSKAKWTIESLGITYKMKRARSE